MRRLASTISASAVIEVDGDTNSTSLTWFLLIFGVVIAIIIVYMAGVATAGVRARVMKFGFITRLVLTSMHVAVVLLFFYYMDDYGWGVYMLFYIPVIVARLFYGLYVGNMASTTLMAQKWQGNPAALLSSTTFPTIAPYLQMCIATLVCLGLLAIRPAYFYSEVSGWRDSSACGKSSCTRSLLIENDAPVYNPNGYFPRGEKEYYDRLGLTEYSFCDWRKNCNWAAATGDNGISYWTEQNNPESGRSRMANDYTSNLKEDYTSNGWGIPGGWRNSIRGIAAKECPGAGTRVCSSCSLYSNTFKGLLGVSNSFSEPEYIDPGVTCAPKPDGSVQPLCFICPAEAEDIDEAALRNILFLHLVLAGEACVSFALVVFISYWTIGSEMSAEAGLSNEDKEKLMETRQKTLGAEFTRRKRKAEMWAETSKRFDELTATAKEKASSAAETVRAGGAELRKRLPSSSSVARAAATVPFKAIKYGMKANTTVGRALALHATNEARKAGMVLGGAGMLAKGGIERGVRMLNRREDDEEEEEEEEADVEEEADDDDESSKEASRASEKGDQPERVPPRVHISIV